jgi:hypothetical protein
MNWTQEDYNRNLAKALAKSPQPKPADAVEDESELHEDIIRYCRSQGWAYVRSRMDKRSTSTVGAPDFVVYASGGRIFSFECKSRTGKLSTAQLAFRLQAEMNGHTVWIVYSIADFHAAIAATKTPCQ